jgi:hypothetical protein
VLPVIAEVQGTDIFDLVHYAVTLKSDFSVDIFRGMMSVLLLNGFRSRSRCKFLSLYYLFGTR